MEPARKRAAAVVLASGLLAAGVLLVSIATAGPEWACEAEERAFDVFDLAPEGGYETREEALVDQAALLARDGVADAAALAESARDGGASGLLLVDGQLVAEVRFAQLPGDGSWTVATVVYCSPAPTGNAGSPLPTPVTGVP